MTNNEPQSESDAQLRSPFSNVEKRSDKYFTFFNWLPSEIIKIGLSVRFVCFGFNISGTRMLDIK